MHTLLCASKCRCLVRYYAFVALVALIVPPEGTCRLIPQLYSTLLRDNVATLAGLGCLACWHWVGATSG